MIFAYNKAHIGDTLLVIVADDQGKENVAVRKGNIAQVKTVDGTLVAWNFFSISDSLTIEGNGQVRLTGEQIGILNDLLKAEGFADVLEEDHEVRIAVGFVKTCKPHPDSDHLSITRTDVGNGEVLQIVCGAPNIKAGQKVVVAKPGAMMPDGLIIWPGNLRGVESYGMICSARELRLPDAPQKKGILELPFDAEVGTPFEVGE